MLLRLVPIWDCCRGLFAPLLLVEFRSGTRFRARVAEVVTKAAQAETGNEVAMEVTSAILRDSTELVPTRLNSELRARFDDALASNTCARGRLVYNADSRLL